MKNLIDHLERIAKTNNDFFLYNIRITPTPNGLLYEFTVQEDCDHHEFYSLSSIDIANFEKYNKEELRKCCLEWNYRYVE